MSPTSGMRQVAVALLHQGDRFLLQLRDDNPKILYPGHWAFFGGHLEPDESPEAAIERELIEEIGYQPPVIHYFRAYTIDSPDSQILRHVFYAPLLEEISTLALNEGMDLGLASLAEIQQGNLFSSRLQQKRPIGMPHRQILLDFLQTGRLQ